MGRKQLSHRPHRAIFAGYSHTTNQQRILLPYTKQTVVSVDIIFSTNTLDRPSLLISCSVELVLTRLTSKETSPDDSEYNSIRPSMSLHKCMAVDTVANVDVNIVE